MWISKKRFEALEAKIQWVEKASQSRHASAIQHSSFAVDQLWHGRILDRFVSLDRMANHFQLLLDHLGLEITQTKYVPAQPSKTIIQKKTKKV